MKASVWKKPVSIYCILLNMKMVWFSKRPFPNLTKKYSTSFIFITWWLSLSHRCRFNYPLNICLAFFEAIDNFFFFFFLALLNFMPAACVIKGHVKACEE